jgi:hypothetical protein
LAKQFVERRNDNGTPTATQLLRTRSGFSHGYFLATYAFKLILPAPQGPATRLPDVEQFAAVIRHGCASIAEPPNSAAGSRGKAL